MEGVGPGLGAQVYHAARELAPIRAKVVVLNLEFANRILCRNEDGQIDVADVKGLTVEVFCALIRERTAYLVIAPAKGVLAHRCATRSALRDGTRRNCNQVENVAPIQG